MAAAKRSVPGQRNRFGDERLWDDEGREWARVSRNLSIREVEEAIADPAVRVGVHDDFGLPLRWVAQTEKKAVWEREIAPRFADGGIRHARKRAPRPHPLTAGLWHSKGDKLLVFEGD
jgi:hypothetical protein